MPETPSCPCITRAGEQLTFDLSDVDTETAGGAYIFSSWQDGARVTVLADLYSAIAYFGEDLDLIGEEYIIWVRTAQMVLERDDTSALGYRLVSLTSYPDWLDGALKRVQDATKAYQEEKDAEGNVSRSSTYTLYIDGWDTGAYYRLFNSQYTTRQGYGCAYVNNSGTESCQGIARFLSYANIVDTASLYGITPKTQYLTPLISDYRTMEVTGSMAYGVYPNGQKLLEYNNISLGTPYFPAIIVPDASV